MKSEHILFEKSRGGSLISEFCPFCRSRKYFGSTRSPPLPRAQAGGGEIRRGLG